MSRRSHIVHSRPWIGALAVVALATSTSCSGPDADPRTALEAVCGESRITTVDDEDASDPDDLVDGEKLRCDAGQHGAVGVRYNREVAETAEAEADEYESGNGDELAYAYLETEDGAGTVVYLYPPDGAPGERRSDPSLLDPLADDGWEIGPD